MIDYSYRTLHRSGVSKMPLELKTSVIYNVFKNYFTEKRIMNILGIESISPNQVIYVKDYAQYKVYRAKLAKVPSDEQLRKERDSIEDAIIAFADDIPEECMDLLHLFEKFDDMVSMDNMMDWYNEKYPKGSVEPTNLDAIIEFADMVISRTINRIYTNKSHNETTASLVECYNDSEKILQLMGMSKEVVDVTVCVGRNMPDVLPNTTGFPNRGLAIDYYSLLLAKELYLKIRRISTYLYLLSKDRK